MVDNKNNLKLQIYERYFDLLDLMVNDMSNVSLKDIAEVLSETHKALNKI